MIRRLLAVSLLAACASTAVPTAPFPRSPSRPHAPRALAVLDDVRAYRGYLVVASALPGGDHFTVWFDDVERGVAIVNVHDAGGATVADVESDAWGGIVGPASPSAIPAEVADAGQAAIAAVQRAHPDARDARLRYTGRTRSVELVGFVAHDFQRGTRRGGWVAHSTLELDAAGKVVRLAGHWTGFGVIEVPADAQWLRLPDPDAGTDIVLGDGVPPAMTDELTAALARYDAQQPSPPIASLVPADAPMLPPGFKPRVTVKIYAGAELRITLLLHDAVFGAGVTGSQEFSRNGHTLTLRATLAPITPATPSPTHVTGTYAGTLAVHLEDDLGRVWEHRYPVSGTLDTEGDAAAAPAGLVVPGGSCPSPECDARDGILPATGGHPAFKIRVDGIDTFDPRHDPA